MTEKRFNRVGGYVYDKDKCISHFEDVKHRDEIIDLLNELHEERNYFERKKCEYWNKFNLAHLDNINLRKENEQLKQQIGELQYSKKMLRATNKDLELGIHNLRKSFEELDTMRIKHIKFLQKRMKKYGISIYYNDDGDVE